MGVIVVPVVKMKDKAAKKISRELEPVTYKSRNQIVKPINFEVNEIVLGRIRGYVFWPGTVRELYIYSIFCLYMRIRNNIINRIFLSFIIDFDYGEPQLKHEMYFEEEIKYGSDIVSRRNLRQQNNL